MNEETGTVPPRPPKRRDDAPTVGKQIAALEKRIAELERNSAVGDLARAARGVKRLRKKLAYLWDQHVLLRMKLEVLTETAWFARTFAPSVATEMSVAGVWAIDLDERWWKRQFSRPLYEVAQAVLAEYRARPPPEERLAAITSALWPTAEEGHPDEDDQSDSLIVLDEEEDSYG
jgi:hypothetical protein